jgi:hypothetical protein
MAIRLILIVSVLLAFASKACLAEGLPPWEFGMTRAQVAAHTEFGPYKKFPNRDLETFNGIFDGKKENIQFFFDESALRRIGVYRYEGDDLGAALSSWIANYQALARLYGPIEVPGFDAPVAGKAADPEQMTAQIRVKVTAGEKVQMAPIQQPKTKQVYANLWKEQERGVDTFFLAIFFDQPQP